MMAAGCAAELGADVLLLEKTDHPGKKILISGNGRCNLTNNRELDSFIEMYGENGHFLYSAFNQFFRDDLLAFLKRYDVETTTEPDGKIYPVSQNAREIVRAFQHYLTDNKVQIQTGVSISHLLVEDKRVVGVQTLTNIYPASAVILATGGASHPQTGSTGDGYCIAAEIGHTIIKIRPGLVPLLVTETKRAKSMQGVSLSNIRLTAFGCTADKIDTSLIPIVDVGRGIPGKRPKPPVIENRTGNAIITHFGLSGPIALEMSLAIVDGLKNGPVSVSIDLKPEVSADDLREQLQRDFDRYTKRSYRNILSEILQSKLVGPFLEMTRVPPEKLGNQITTEERERLSSLIKSLRFNIKGPYSLSTAMVTAGGISLKEIDPHTMGSRLAEGLYFCGEVMDIDASTGGYNLQAAFSTGYVAGEHAAAYVLTGH